MNNHQQIGDIFMQLERVLMMRKTNTNNKSYVANLYKLGDDSILKKIGEEASEVIIATKNNKRIELIYEIADLWFHTLVLLCHKNISTHEVADELSKRFGISGFTEKKNRSLHSSTAHKKIKLKIKKETKI